jgi:hypothetical protein
MNYNCVRFFFVEKIRVQIIIVEKVSMWNIGRFSRRFGGSHSTEKRL